MEVVSVVGLHAEGDPVDVVSAHVSGPVAQVAVDGDALDWHGEGDLAVVGPKRRPEHGEQERKTPQPA